MIKSTFKYKKYIINDLTDNVKYSFDNTTEASKKYDELRKVDASKKLLYEVVFPDYKQSEVKHIFMDKG